MKLTIASAATIALVSTTSHASECTVASGTTYPEFEAVKDAFFHAEHEQMIDALGPLFQLQRAQLMQQMAAAANVIPGAYASCETVLQRFEEPGFYQEITLFTHDSFDGVITMHLVGAEIDGTIQMVEFTFNSDTSSVLDGLH